jgi:hypothetical protein
MTSQPLDDGEEVLLRQIHPDFYDNNYPSSTPFAPSAKDDNKLSVDRSSLTTPAESHALFTGNGFRSAAVYGVSVGEFNAEGISCHPDPLEANDKLAANPAHAYADFSTYTKQQSKNIAKRLRNNAVKRGPLYQQN